jgi:outer membrane protein TolC
MLALVLVSVGWLPVSGEEPVSQMIGPGDAARIALERNPMLRMADADVQLAQADRRAAGGGYLPRIEFTEDWVRSDNPVFVFSSKLLQGIFTPEDFDIRSLNTPDPITNSTARVSIYQNIWNGRAAPRRKAATAGIAAAESSQQKTRDTVVFGALKAYWDLVLAGQMARVTDDAEAAAEANLTLATELFEGGLAVSSDRMSAEVRLADVRAMSIRAKYAVDVAHAALLRALGEDRPEVRYVPFEIDTRPVMTDDTLEQRLERAHAQRSDLDELDRLVEQAQVGTRVARSTYYPELGAIGRYEWNGVNLLGADADNWAIGLAVRFTIFDGNSTHAGSQRARAELAKLQATRVVLTQSIRLEVESAWAERESAWRRLDVAETALRQAGDALRIVRDRYGEGMAVIVELLTAEAALTQARANHAAAIGELWLADAGLDLASGTDPLPDQPINPNPGRS